VADEDPTVARAAELAAIGLRPGVDPAAVDAAATGSLDHPDPRVRVAALGALVRAGSPTTATRAWSDALHDDDPNVRRRTAELAPTLESRTPLPNELVTSLVDTISDPDATVIEAAAWALGELGGAAITAGATTALARVATAHDDALAREAAVAALGALGDPAGLDAVLAACRDKPAVRRRAVLALAPFEGTAVDAALAAAREDRDWQVRQAAEDLLAAARDDPAEERHEEADPS